MGEISIGSRLIKANEAIGTFSYIQPKTQWRKSPQIQDVYQIFSELQSGFWSHTCNPIASSKMLKKYKWVFS